MSKRIVKNALVSSKVPKPTTFSNKKSNHYLADPDRPIEPPTKKFFINLEDLVNIEEILSILIDKIQNSESAIEECENWWEITDENSIVRIDGLFKREEVKQSLREAVILEAVGVSLAQFLDHTALGNTSATEALSELLENIHQNFLVLIDIVLHRLPNSYSTNSWAVTLQAITFNKRKTRTSKSQNVSLLKAQNSMVKEKIEEVAQLHTNPGAVLSRGARELLYSISQVLKDINQFEVLQVREALKEKVRQETEQDPQTLNTTESMDFETDLPLVEAPYLPSVGEGTYTLVLDLDETLVHYIEEGNTGRYLVRPGCYEFLEQVSRYYQVVIFTAALQEYADWVLDEVDSCGWISYRLYRQHAIPAGSYFIKDLSRTGRELTKMIIVDNVAENFQMQPDNGILIRSWFEDPNDNALKELLPLLKQIVQKRVKDVRAALRSFRDQMMSLISQGVPNPHLNLELSDDL